MHPPILSRLAPTPSGYLHTGNAYNFLLNWLAARSTNGRVLLRIDDLDAARVRDEYLDDIFRTLEWLGLDWDIGPTGTDDFKKNWSQTLRAAEYAQTLQCLTEKNALFACTCSRKMLGDAPVYPRVCNAKNIPLDTPDVAWRLHIDETARTVFEDLESGHIIFETGQKTGCAVLRRRDGVAAYHIASLTDDLTFGINYIARGMDLLPSTALQLHIASQLDAQPFLQTRFLHHGLVETADGRKLSKSAGDTSLNALRENGMQPADLLRGFAARQGLNDAHDIRDVYGLAKIWPLREIRP